MALSEITAKLKIEPTISTLVLNNGDIQQVVELKVEDKIQHLSTIIYKASEDEIKNALIAMGWTPPEEKEK